MDSDIEIIQREIKTGKRITILNCDEIKYLQRPIGKALYFHAQDKENIKKPLGRPKVENKKRWYDILQCNMCGKEYKRSHRSDHNKTVHHKAYAAMNDKMRMVLLGDTIFPHNSP